MDRAVKMAESGMVAVHGLDFNELNQMCSDLTREAGNPEKHISLAVERFYKSGALGGSNDLVGKVLNREHVLVSICLHPLFYPHSFITLIIKK